MRQEKRVWPHLLIVLSLLWVPATASAQELYTYTVGLLGGVGGSTDADPGNDLGNLGVQLNLSLVTEPRTHLGFRLGQLDLDVDEGFGTLTNAELTYVTVAGEYRTAHTFYDSGVYFGLGGYRLQGNSIFGGASQEDTAFGVTLGLTGEFPITRSFGVMLELSAHYADLKEAQIFAMGHVGLALHF